MRPVEDLVRERRAVAAGLLVRPLAGHERRDVELVDEGGRRERVGDLRDVVVVVADLRLQVRLLGMEGLVRLADLIVVVDDPVLGVGLAAEVVRVRGRVRIRRRHRLRLVLPLIGPGDGEAGVELAAGVEGRLRLVDHRERRERGQVRGLGLAGEELADAAVGDAEHPDLAVRDPGLVRHRLDHVVAVEALGRLEEVEGAAGAAGAAHVDVDDGEAHQVGERLRFRSPGRPASRSRSRSTRPGSARDWPRSGSGRHGR